MTRSTRQADCCLRATEPPAVIPKLACKIVVAQILL